MSYTLVKENIQDFALVHRMVAQFQSENVDGIHAVDGYDYPLVFMNPLNESKATNGYSYQVQLYILDYPTNEKWDSAEYCIKKCHKIAHDLFDFLWKKKRVTPQSITINSLADYAFDKVQGVEVTFDILASGGCVKYLDDILL